MFIDEEKKKISFVIPCYRSEKTIEAVCNEILSVLQDDISYDYEIIAINDSSPDNVLAVLKKLATTNHKIKVLDFAKNMGKHAALMAGFRFCTGDYVVCLDDDGQCPVDQLWHLLEPLRQGYDVSMAQYGTKAQSKFKNFGSRVNAWMMESLGKPKEFQFANFAAMKRFIVDEMIRYDNPYSYVNGLILRTTERMANVPMKERNRKEGVGGYTFSKSLKLWINGYTAFSIIPLRLATILGVFFAGVGFIATLVIVVRKVINPEILAGYTSTLTIILFMGGLIMLILGIMGEYIGRIYMCLNNAPQYVIRESINVEEHNDEFSRS